MKSYLQHKEKLILAFCATNSVREELKKPKRFDKYWCSTDAHVAILLPIEKMEHVEGVLNLSSTIDRAGIVNTPISMEAIRIALNTLDSKPGVVTEYRDCESCDGTGASECSCCGNVTDCDDCNGNGSRVIKETPVDWRRFDDYDYVKLCEAVFDPNLLEKIVYAANLLGLKDEAVIASSGRLSPMVIEVEDVKFLVMPRSGNPEQKVTVNIQPATA